MTFSVHDVLRDPAFAKLDIVFCRNVIVRFAAEVRSEMLSLFYFALEPLGYLVLGRGDTSSVPEGFSNLDDGQPIFKRPRYRSISVAERPLLAGFRLRPPTRTRGAREASRVSVRTQAERMLLRDFAPTCIVFNEKFEILQCLGKSDDWLEVPSGVPTSNLFAMTRPELRAQIRGFVTVAVAQRDACVTTEVDVTLDQVMQRLKLTVKPLPDIAGVRNHALIIQQGTPTENPCSHLSSDGTVASAELFRTELQQTRAELEGIVERFESRNQSLQSVNEELLDMNEELESSNQEMKAFREQLLGRNRELGARIAELSMAEADARKVVEMTGTPTVFVDGELRVLSFTAAAQRLFGVSAGDQGRRLSDLARRFECEDFEQKLRDVVQTHVSYEAEVRAADESWFILCVQPCRSGSGDVGAVIHFSDVTRAKNAELELKRLRSALLRPAQPEK